MVSEYVDSVVVPNRSENSVLFPIKYGFGDSETHGKRAKPLQKPPG
jgi:hypothetical protein